MKFATLLKKNSLKILAVSGLPLETGPQDINDG